MILFQNKIKFLILKKLSEKETEIQNVLSKYNSEFETFKITGNTNLESDRKKFSNILKKIESSLRNNLKVIRKILKIFDETTVSTKDEFDNASEVLNSKLEEAKKL